MNSLKTTAANIFASLGYTREQREALYQDTVTEMFNAVKDICDYQLKALTSELNNFNSNNWLLGDECGNAVLILRDLGKSEIDEVGSMAVAMMETGEIIVRISLDGVYEDGFEPIFLESKDPTLLALLNKYVEETTKSYGLAGFTILFGGKDVLQK